MNNKNHRIFFFFLVFSLLVNGGNTFAKKSKDREYWVKTMIKIIDPIYQFESEYFEEKHAC